MLLLQPPASTAAVESRVPVISVVQDIADALCELAEDPPRLRAMGDAAARRAREEFSWARQAARMAGLYRALCVARHPRNGDVTEVTA